MEHPPADNELVHSRLSRISTVWPMLATAHEGSQTEAATARLAFVQRYQRAAYRYLLGALRDADAADELFQEMILRFVRGDFRQADPDKGRFRNYLKTTLSQLVVDYHKRQQKRPLSLDSSTPLADEPASDSHDSDVAFLSNWRDELLERAWEKLELAERSGASPVYSVLRYRVENPDASSSDIALALTVERNVQPALTPENVRKLLQRARQQFGDHLLDEVAASLQHPTPTDVEQELSDLDLLRFCRGALRRHA